MVNVGTRLRHRQPKPSTPSNAAKQPAVKPAQDAKGRIKCLHCPAWILPCSMDQHLNLYCPARASITGVRNMPQACKIVRPVPPSKQQAGSASSAAPPPPKAAAVNVPKPGVHVRWSVPLAQPKRNSSSMPGQRDENYPKNARGPSQRPADKPTDAQLRAAMEASSSTASSSKASSSKTSSSKASSSKTPSAQPAVPKPAKPKNAPRGSRLRSYCNQWMPSGHEENCQPMPYEFWIWATQQRQILKYGDDV